jgi:hypothetical protein
MFDNVVLLTIGIILGLATLGAILRVRRRDTCLKSFSGYPVYVRMKSGKQIWGRLRTESTGIELNYRTNHFDSEGHVESSFIIFKGEFPNIQVIMRFTDELTGKGARKRAKTLQRSYHPNPYRRTRRKLRNWFNIMRDAVSESLTAVISAATKTSPVSAQQAKFGKSSAEVIEWFGNAYDPIIEHHIGKKVVVEVTLPDGRIIEHVGVFREYSPDYLEVIDVEFKEDGKIRRVDLIIPRAHGHIRHNSEPVVVRKVEQDERAPALLKDPSEPETVAQS